MHRTDGFGCILNRGHLLLGQGGLRITFAPFSRSQFFTGQVLEGLIKRSENTTIKFQFFDWHHVSICYWGGLGITWLPFPDASRSQFFTFTNSPCMMILRLFQREWRCFKLIRWDWPERRSRYIINMRMYDDFEIVPARMKRLRL